jgi:hypothetical protein
MRINESTVSSAVVKADSLRIKRVIKKIEWGGWYLKLRYLAMGASEEVKDLFYRQVLIY